MPNFPVAPDSPEPALSPSPEHPGTPPELNSPTWDFAARRLLAKMLGEFAYEEIVSPVPAPAAAGDAWTLTLDDGSSLGFALAAAPTTAGRSPQTPSPRPPPPHGPRSPSGTRTSSWSAPAPSCASTVPRSDT